jgi:Membrane transporters of cations and cationic drugs
MGLKMEGDYIAGDHVYGGCAANVRGKKRRAFQMLGLIIYVILSATGLTLIKIGTGQNNGLVLDTKGFLIQLNWTLILGMVMYVMSFLLSMAVMKGMNLSLFYPLSAGLIYIAICGISYFILKEKIIFSQWLGMAVILTGIIIMNLGKGN